ncbi:conserved oligomeric Golgi complex subunit 5-like [Eurytemora carolleeae]|uniref:conserved oligomeric Golgi complex subunit 5-like n=1 Tax=Eurytemora carolleeae TaxID=1294199 RepID=UPI000C75FCA8|nr:conserved oligomeric Golgi complex subunit 5-like [Eurytemora carolleeae]XP_023320325.1 conserved oligomeric Golgi complex subunit 5-like [Eurytemora carolleeae]XP_023320326.1 conserved oligomeric Golgi complex subunit 5-like [Eurytemora carolleeae]|eukprot:XP_023320324.1 conserved oligomeric Golgi complex subunit 5-like [Eurytemora affinis]
MSATELDGVLEPLASEEPGVWKPQQFLEPYLAEDFEVESHATSILQQGNINQEVNKLSIALSDLDSTIQSHVSLHYNDLLSRAVSNSQLEQSLAAMATHIGSLELSSERLRSRVAEPYGKIKQGTQSLERLQNTADILRRVIRILQLSKRLSVQLAGTGDLDLAKAASGLAELGELVEGDLSGIEVVEGEVRRMWAWRTDVERQGETLLTRGMETANQSHLGTGLQVFYNLGTLPEVLTKLLDTSLTRLKTQASDLLDIRKISAAADEAGKGGSKNGGASKGGGPGKASMPAPSNMAAFRATLWTNLDQVLELVRTTISRILQLQKLLAKKQDPNTHLPYISALAQEGHDPSIVDLSWSKVTKILRDVLVTSASKSNFIKQAFEGEYPKMLRLYLETWSKLRLSAVQVNTTGLIMDESLIIKDPFLNEELGADLSESLEQFEHAYLARSLSRLFDPVNLMFSGGGVPSQTEVSGIFTTLSSELNIGAVEPRLQASVLSNVSKTIKLFCVKCEQAAKADSDASQVIGYPTVAQKQNVELVNILADFQIGLTRLVAENKSKKIETLLEVGKGISAQMVSTIAPLLSSIEDAVEAILLTAHKEEFGQEENSKQPPCSPYMKELQAFLERISKDFLQHFTCKDFLDGELRPLAEKIINEFVLHASLIRPLGAGGALRLASDCAQLEFALTLILGPSGFSSSGPTGLNAIGPAYQLLRSYRALLFLNPEDIQKYDGLGSVVPYSVGLHLLISRCPPVMPSPQASLGWGLARYTRWLQKHDEREKLLLIQGTLEAYVAGSRSRSDKNYIPQYPVLLQILQKGLES